MFCYVSWGSSLIEGSGDVNTVFPVYFKGNKIFLDLNTFNAIVVWSNIVQMYMKMYMKMFQQY